MISRAIFIEIIDAVERQYKRDYKIGGIITSIGDIEIMGSNNRFVYTTQLNDDVLNALAKEFNDTDGNISYYVYELDFGAKADDMTIRTADKRIIKLHDAGALYDWLMECI